MYRAAPHAEEDRREAIVFDVDGTLCDVRTVRHFVESSTRAQGFKRDFESFHSGSLECPPHTQVLQMAIRAHNFGFAVLVVTGREARWRELTLKWLNANHVPFDELWTRVDRDYRPDRMVKAEIAGVISERYRALLAIDDRLDIIDVWQRAGISTMLVSTDGEISPIKPNSTVSIKEELRCLLNASEEK